MAKKCYFFANFQDGGFPEQQMGNYSANKTSRLFAAQRETKVYGVFIFYHAKAQSDAKSFSRDYVVVNPGGALPLFMGGGDQLCW